MLSGTRKNSATGTPSASAIWYSRPAEIRVMPVSYLCLLIGHADQLTHLPLGQPQHDAAFAHALHDLALPMRNGNGLQCRGNSHLVRLAAPGSVSQEVSHSC
jgi:hypothetical protein